METMTTLREDTVKGVAKLVRMNRDAAGGFSEAAEKIDCPHCRGVFNDAANERRRFEHELVSALQISDEDIPDGGTALGALRGMSDMNVPTVITLVAYWPVALPASYLLGFVLDLGAVGVWLGYTVGLVIAAVALPVRFWRLTA